MRKDVYKRQGETRGTIEETFRFIQAIQPDFYQVNVWSCEVNSDIYLARQNYHLVLNGKNWSHDTMDTQQAHAAVTYIQMCIRDRIYTMQVKAAM